MARGLRRYVKLASRYGGNIRAPRAPPNIIPLPHEALAITTRSLPCGLTKPFLLPHEAFLVATRSPCCGLKERGSTRHLCSVVRAERVYLRQPQPQPHPQSQPQPERQPQPQPQLLSFLTMRAERGVRNTRAAKAFILSQSRRLTFSFP